MSAREMLLRSRSLPETVPLFPIVGALLLPGGQLPLNVFEPRYLRLIDDALGGARLVGMVQPRSGSARGRPPLYAVGCAGRITSFAETGDNRYLVTLTGRRRFEIAREVQSETPYRVAQADWSKFPKDELSDPSAAVVDRDRLERAMRNYLDAEGLKTDWEMVGQAPMEALVASLAMGCPFAPNEKQALLEAPTTSDRAECLIALMEMAGGPDQGSEPSVQ
jgi:hypothetical protein